MVFDDVFGMSSLADELRRADKLVVRRLARNSFDSIGISLGVEFPQPGPKCLVLFIQSGRSAAPAPV